MSVEEQRSSQKLAMLLASITFLECVAGCASRPANQRIHDPDYMAGQESARLQIKSEAIIFLDATAIKRAWTDKERRMLRQEYGIDYKDGRCLSAAYIAGFNEEMSREAVSRFGPDYRAKLAYRQSPDMGYPRHSLEN